MKRELTKKEVLSLYNDGKPIVSIKMARNIKKDVKYQYERLEKLTNIISLIEHAEFMLKHHKGGLETAIELNSTYLIDKYNKKADITKRAIDRLWNYYNNKLNKN